MIDKEELKKRLKKEMLEELDKLKDNLMKEPNIQNFKDNYEKLIKENEEFDERLERMFNPKDISILFKVLS